MNAASEWSVHIERVERLRQEAASRRLLALCPRTNVWARLLPPLRRLEGWLERHAGTSQQPGTTWKRQAR